MDLFEQIRQREEDKCKNQAIKVQKLREKLQKADKKFFDHEDSTDGAANEDYRLRQDLLTFRATELKTVFTEDVEEDGKYFCKWFDQVLSVV